MKTTLPKFEGQQVQAARLKLSGHSDERVGALASEEDVYLIVRGVVAHIDHGNVGDVFTRTHTVRATAAILMSADQGARILDEAAMLADERFGVQNLFGGGTGPKDDGPADDGGPQK